MTELVVIKQNLQRDETWRYPAKLLERRPNAVVIEAYFNRSDTEVAGLLIHSGARFVEIYFADRWYNIFEIYAPDGTVSGWYCNISLPAEITDGRIAYVDLALDLLVFPDGTQKVLDEDEFEALEPAPELREQALRALAELSGLFDAPVTFRVLLSENLA